MIKSNEDTVACAPIKKSGNGSFFVPLFFLYLRNAFPVKKRASRGSYNTFMLSCSIAFSSSSILLNPIETSV